MQLHGTHLCPSIAGGGRVDGSHPDPLRRHGLGAGLRDTADSVHRCHHHGPPDGGHQGARVTRDDPLPVTGSDLVGLAVIGGGLVLVGGGVLIARRRTA